MAKQLNKIPQSHCFLNNSSIPAMTNGKKLTASAFVLCPTCKIISKYVEKPKAIAPKSAIGHGILMIINSK